MRLKDIQLLIAILLIGLGIGGVIATISGIQVPLIAFGSAGLVLIIIGIYMVKYVK